MRMPSKIKATRNKGLNRVVSSGQMEHLALDLIVFGKNEKHKLDTGEFETVIVPLKGTITIHAEGENYMLSRKDVFTERASALCLPIDTRAEINATEYTEAAICKAKTDKKGKIVFIPKEDTREKTVGRDSWKRRVVDIVDGSKEVSKIVLGETFNEPAGWSSFPPHKHDTPIPGVESRMEEIYLFRLNPSEGFGTQSVYGKDDLNYTFKVGDYDAVTIPWGYHPVSAMPGYRLYYLWFLAGEGRTLLPNTDPKYKWLEEKIA